MRENNSNQPYLVWWYKLRLDLVVHINLFKMVSLFLKVRLVKGHSFDLCVIMSWTPYLLIHHKLCHIKSICQAPKMQNLQRLKKQEVMAASCMSSADKITRLCGYLYKVMPGESICDSGKWNLPARKSHNYFWSSEGENLVNGYPVAFEKGFSYFWEIFQENNIHQLRFLKYIVREKLTSEPEKPDLL